ncbi:MULTISPECIES: MarR family winged helix-turn-helix transcriptional regulator [Streptomyces]|uniref:MarR family transcriptional regulator n=2 Tax=Streptomyces TaxID=1883 RepID=A0A2U9NWT1_STRAS|nr:MarR family winged helix-turn-helix transcriptional regulator [Streptomyces actuosus]AWT41727.1 MarR family transcriptional regulator [Streptomyces actuosus]MBM4825678.1 winged helix-turn-helix transcriptional regulator [Streptomyces actuosus]
MSEPAAEADLRLYFLLQRAAHQLRTSADRRLADAAGITTAQLGALFAVQDRPGITQQQLARTLGLRESAVTGLVTRLTTAGLVTKQAHPSEHRAVVLDLTDTGTTALRAAQPEIDRFNAELRAVLGDDGFARTAVALRRLVEWGT